MGIRRFHLLTIFVFLFHASISAESACHWIIYHPLSDGLQLFDIVLILVVGMYMYLTYGNNSPPSKCFLKTFHKVHLRFFMSSALKYFKRNGKTRHHSSKSDFVSQSYKKWMKLFLYSVGSSLVKQSLNDPFFLLFQEEKYLITAKMKLYQCNLILLFNKKKLKKHISFKAAE